METELLKHLKLKAVQTEVEARGAYHAYMDELNLVTQDTINKMGINKGDHILVHYTNSDVKYVFEGIELRHDWQAKEDERFQLSDRMWRVLETPYLLGKRILKSGKPSKSQYDEIIPAYLIHLVEKVR